MKSLATFIISLLIPTLLAAQQPQVEWEVLFGTESWEKAYSVAVVQSGGFIVVGSQHSDKTSSDVSVIRLDVTGAELWSKTFGGDKKDLATSIALTEDGGFAIAGATQSTGAGGFDFYIVKMTSLGEIEWEKTYGDFGDESANDIIATPDGGFAVTGYTKSLGNKAGLVWVLKLDKLGNLQWSSSHGGDKGGGIPSDVGNKIVTRPGGGYAVAAHTRSIGAGDEDMYLIVLEENGTVKWEKTYGDTKEEKAYDLIANADGSFILAGYTESTGMGSDDAYVMKIDAAGMKIWAKTFGGHGADQVHSIVSNEKGGFVLAGSTHSKGPVNSGMWIFAIDKEGVMKWELTFPGYEGYDNINTILTTPDNGFIATGQIWSKGAGKSDIWTCKLQGDVASAIDWYVLEKITPWMVRGEFEKTADYDKRIGGENMKKVKEKYISEAINYFGALSIDLKEATLGRYNADGESFNISFPESKSIEVAVSINEAQLFKQNWKYVEFQNPSFKLTKDKLLLSKVEMSINGKKYEFNHPEGGEGNQILQFRATGEVETEEIPIYRGSGDPLKGLNVERSQNLTVGKYYGLIIGIDDYKGSWNPLANAVHDAKSVEKSLRGKYRFNQIKTLYNEAATRENIINEFLWLVDHVKENDNVFIYYSGHGEFEKKLNKGYWVPVDAQTSSISIYISNSDIQTFLGSIASKHTLMVADACFSGDIFRGKTVSVPFEDSEKYFKKVYGLKSVQAISSGGIEPVMDGGRDGHSVFAYYFLKALNENKAGYLDGSQLFDKIKVPIVNNSDQSPKFQPVKNTGDEGGQFVFIRR